MASEWRRRGAAGGQGHRVDTANVAAGSRWARVGRRGLLRQRRVQPRRRGGASRRGRAGDSTGRRVGERRGGRRLTVCGPAGRGRGAAGTAHVRASPLVRVRRVMRTGRCSVGPARRKSPGSGGTSPERRTAEAPSETSGAGAVNAAAFQPTATPLRTAAGTTGAPSWPGWSSGGREGVELGRSGGKGGDRGPSAPTACTSSRGGRPTGRSAYWGPRRRPGRGGRGGSTARGPKK